MPNWVKPVTSQFSSVLFHRSDVNGPLVKTVLVFVLKRTNECAYISGTGTFGRVVLVQHTPSEDYFALKMLTISEVLKLKQVDHVKNEKEVLSTVRHPFIVNMYADYSIYICSD